MYVATGIDGAWEIADKGTEWGNDGRWKNSSRDNVVTSDRVPAMATDRKLTSKNINPFATGVLHLKPNTLRG